MEKLTTHHSLADWDWQPNTLAHLDSWTVISPPTCLAVPSRRTGYWEWTWFYLKPPLGQNIPHGLFATYLWTEEQMNPPHLCVRAQDLPVTGAGLRLPANCYYLMLVGTYTRLFRRVNNTDTLLLHRTLVNQLLPQRWNHIAFFWETLQLPTARVCRFTFQVKVAQAWITEFEYDDPANQWEQSTVNRVGFHLAGTFYNNLPQYKGRVDDTEIWKRKDT